MFKGIEIQSKILSPPQTIIIVKSNHPREINMVFFLLSLKGQDLWHYLKLHKIIPGKINDDKLPFGL